MGNLHRMGQADESAPRAIDSTYIPACDTLLEDGHRIVEIQIPSRYPPYFDYDVVDAADRMRGFLKKLVLYRPELRDRMPYTSGRIDKVIVSEVIEGGEKTGRYGIRLGMAPPVMHFAEKPEYSVISAIISKHDSMEQDERMYTEAANYPNYDKYKDLMDLAARSARTPVWNFVRKKRLLGQLKRDLRQYHSEMESLINEKEAAQGRHPLSISYLSSEIWIGSGKDMETMERIEK